MEFRKLLMGRGATELLLLPDAGQKGKTGEAGGGGGGG